MHPLAFMRQHGMKSESERRKTDKAYQGFLGVFQLESYDNITSHQRGMDIFTVLIYTYRGTYLVFIKVLCHVHS